MVASRKRQSTRRRGFLVLGIVFALNSGGCGDQASRKTETVRLVSWGGQAQTDLLRFWIKPAAEKANIEIVAESWDGDYAALSNRIKRGVNTWDLVHVELYYLVTPSTTNSFAQFPDLKTPGIRTSFLANPSVAGLVAKGTAWPVLEYGVLLAYNDSKLSPSLSSASQTPSWNDFFDTRSYPGVRGGPRFSHREYRNCTPLPRKGFS